MNLTYFQCSASAKRYQLGDDGVVSIKAMPEGLLIETENTALLVRADGEGAVEPGEHACVDCGAKLKSAAGLHGHRRIKHEK